MGMTKLYRRTADGLEYWEHWTNDGVTTVHTGRVGERGDVERFEDKDAFAAFFARTMPELLQSGFRGIPEDEHASILVQWPPDTVPEALDEIEALWDNVEHLVNEELGWTGLGHCSGVDYSSELTAMAEAVDADLAVKVLADALAHSDLPGGALIAVRVSDDDNERDEIRWPPDRHGEELPA